MTWHKKSADFISFQSKSPVSRHSQAVSGQFGLFQAACFGKIPVLLWQKLRANKRLKVKFMQPLVGIIMGSVSDWETMSNAADKLTELGVSFEVEVVSAHRTPDKLFDYAEKAAGRGIEVIIAGAGGAAHLPGMTAAKTSLPVLGVPVQSKALSGMDSLLSIAQMPAGIPVGTLAIGNAGATNAALLAAAILGNKYPQIREALDSFREAQTETVLSRPDPRAVD